MHKVKILHIMCAGRMVALDNVFCGAIEAGHDIIVKGDLTTWLGDVETINGNICVSGNLCAEGRVIADSGYVIVNKDLEKIGEPKALGTWSGSEGQPLPQEMRDIASTSGRLVKALMSKLGML